MTYQVIYQNHVERSVVTHSTAFIITHYKQVFFLTVLKLHFTNRRQTSMTNLRPIPLLMFFPKYARPSI
jgi:hypothetical protein